MANHKSDQITLLDASPPEKLPPDVNGGKVRRRYFSFTAPVGGVAIGDTVELAELAGAAARVFGGYAEWDAMTTGAGVATMELGDGVTANRFLEATDVDAAGSTPFADTRARGYGTKLAGGRLIATASVEAWAAGAQLVGHVDFVSD